MLLKNGAETTDSYTLNARGRENTSMVWSIGLNHGGKMRYLIFSALFVAVFIASCATQITQPINAGPTPDGSPKPVIAAKLSWEKDKPSRAAWTIWTFDQIALHFEKLDKAQDANLLCEDYAKMPKEKKIILWGELISQMAKYESGWDPTSYYKETTMGIDPVTGEQVASQGALQLSYQDVKNYPKLKCRIDFSKDKGKALKDPSRTILDPFINLECGIGILATQIERKGKIILSSGLYWSVLREGSDKSKKILAAVQDKCKELK